MLLHTHWKVLWMSPPGLLPLAAAEAASALASSCLVGMPQSLPALFYQGCPHGGVPEPGSTLQVTAACDCSPLGAHWFLGLLSGQGCCQPRSSWAELPPLLRRALPAASEGPGGATQPR